MYRLLKHFLPLSFPNRNKYQASMYMYQLSLRLNQPSMQSINLPTRNSTSSLGYQPISAAYRPSAASYQPSTYIYQPSLRLNQPSMQSINLPIRNSTFSPGYQPISAVYRPSAASYQPSTYIYQPSHRLNQPSMQSINLQKAVQPAKTSPNKKGIDFVQ